MRGVSGVIALVLGIAALLGGLGLQTVWAPPTTLTATVDDELIEAPLTVITGGIAEVDEEPVEYTLTADGEYTVMLGRQQDIQAWVGDAAHHTVTGIDTNTGTDTAEETGPRVLVEHTEGETQVPNPAGSDLWVETQEASGTIEQRWTVPEDGDWALLVAAGGTEPAPTEMTVSWTNPAPDSPWIRPLVIGGSVLVLTGLALLLWALLRRRRDGGPHGPGTGAPAAQPKPGPHGSTAAGTGTASVTGTAGPGRVRRVGAVGTAGMLSLILAGAGSATASPSASPEGSEAATDQGQGEGGATGTSGTGEYPVVVDAQLERILGQVAQTVRAGDEDRDVERLRPRVGGQALQMRSLNYRNQDLDDSVGAPEPVAATPVLSAVAVSDPAFPRHVTAITEGEENETPQIVVLRQDAPRAQYRMIAATSMTPGAELPGSTLAHGARTLAPTETDQLVMPPGHALGATARFLSDPDDPAGRQVADNDYIQAIHDYQQDVVENSSDASVRFNRLAVDDATLTMTLPDGSALLVGHVDARLTALPREPGGRIVTDELPSLIAGEEVRSTTEGLDMTYREAMALRVPPAGAEGPDAQISLVGMTDVLSGAEFRD